MFPEKLKIAKVIPILKKMIHRFFRELPTDFDLTIDFQTRTTNLKPVNTILKRSIHTAKKTLLQFLF